MADMQDILSGSGPDDGQDDGAQDASTQGAPVQTGPTTVTVNAQPDDQALQTTPDETTSTIPYQQTQNGPVQTQSPQTQPSPQQQAAPQAAPAKPASPWQKILMGALAGMSGVGPHDHTFGQGLAGGARGSMQYNQQQQEQQNQQQQLDMQRQRLTMEQQQSTDNHATAQAQLAMTQAQVANLHRAYNLAPKTLQDVIDQKDTEAGAQLTADGVPTVGEGLSKQDALSTIMAHRNADPNSALQYIMHQDGNGGFNVYKIADPNKLNDAPVDVTIGYDASGKPITKNYAPNTVSIAQRMNVESSALTNYVNQQNSLSQFQKEQQIETAQAGPRAYATASAQVRAAQAGGTAPKNADGSWNQSSLPVMLVNGQMDPSQLSKRSKDYDQQLSLANQYSLATTGKPFDIAQAQSDYRTATNQQTQSTLKLINGITEQGGALDIAANAAQALPKGFFTPVNKLFNATATTFGSQQETNFHTAMLGLADEYSKVMGGGVSSDTGRQQALNILQAGYSKGQMDGAINTLRQDVAARKTAIVGNNRYLQNQYGGQQPQQPAQTIASPQRVVPAGATPGRDAQGNIVGYRTANGQVVAF